MDYHKKYLKYKNKYIELKNKLYNKNNILIGGIKNYFLPCDIYHYTESIEILSTIYNYIIDEKYKYLLTDKINFFYDDKLYRRDYLILLNPIINQLNQIEYKKIGIISKDKHIRNGIEYGGNFIASPPIINNNLISQKIFCFSGASHIFLDKINTNVLDQEIIELKCSFTYFYERHIDECLCFMPYRDDNGVDTYKIWIYKIRNLYLSSSLEKLLETILQLSEEEKNIINQNIINNNNITTKYGKLYKLLLKQSLLFEQIKNNNLHNYLEIERLENLNIISNALFNGNYDMNKDKFVEFPIDLYVYDTLSFYITSPSIFNRVFINRPDNEPSLLLYPDIYTITKNNYEIMKEYVPHSSETIEMIKKDLMICNENILKDNISNNDDYLIFYDNYLKERQNQNINYSLLKNDYYNIYYVKDEEVNEIFQKYINTHNKNIISIPVNTLMFHNDGNVGGNIHCLTQNNFTIQHRFRQ